MLLDLHIYIYNEIQKSFLFDWILDTINVGSSRASKTQIQMFVVGLLFWLCYWIFSIYNEIQKSFLLDWILNQEISMGNSEVSKIQIQMLVVAAVP